LDLSVLPSPFEKVTADVSATAKSDSTMNPYKNGLPDSVAQMQAKAYADLFKLLLKYKKNVSRVTFWGVNDAQSWLNNFPIRGRTDYPLLFDRNFKPKPAFYSVIATNEK
jgi:endo-1,4-beta-xylanase